MERPVILSAVRTPIGKFMVGLAPMRAIRLKTITTDNLNLADVICM